MAKQLVSEQLVVKGLVVKQLSREQLADRLLIIIRERTDWPFQLTWLVQETMSDPRRILTALELLMSWGYHLRMASDSVSFLAPADSLTATEIGYQLKTKLIGRQILSYHSVGSTNDMATRMAESGSAEGLLVTAEEQTRGRGRLGRHWHSPPGNGIYLSILLRPSFKPEMAPGVSIMTGLALADALAGYFGDRVQIKWPNDLLISGKKVAGILTELSAEQNRINHLIVGVGINVNQRAGDFPQNIRPTATSIRRALRKTGRFTDRIRLLQQFLVNFEREYQLYVNHQLKKSLSRLGRYSSLTGRKVEILSGKNRLIGTAKGIDATGALLLESDGKTSAVSSGEITIAK